MREFARKITCRISYIKSPLEKLVLFRISTLFSIGSVLSTLIGFEIVLILSVCFILYALLSGRYTKNFALSIFSILFAVFSVVFFSTRPSLALHKGRNVEVVGKVVKEVEESANYMKLTIKPIKIRDLDSDMELEVFKGHILAKGQTLEEVFYGDEVVLTGTIKKPENFEGFSYVEYLKAQNTYTTIDFDSFSVYQKGSDLLYQIKKYKRFITSKVESILPIPHSTLFSGIIYGAKGNMSEEFEENLSVTGTTHIVAVSGYNISVIISFLSVSSYLLGRRRMSILIISFLTIFMIFVGIDNIPVVRATFMGISLMISQLIGRKRAVVSLMSLTVAVLLLINPLTFKLLSFQLSFLSTLGLVVMTDTLEKKLTFLPFFTREDAASTIAAMIFTLPISLVNFNRFSVLALFVNFFILPVIPIITIGGFVSIIILSFSTFLGKIVTLPFWLLLEYTICIINFSSGFKYASIEIAPAVSTWATCLLYGFISYLTIEMLYAKNQKENL